MSTILHPVNIRKNSDDSGGTFALVGDPATAWSDGSDATYATATQSASFGLCQAIGDVAPVDFAGQTLASYDISVRCRRSGSPSVSTSTRFAAVTAAYLSGNTETAATSSILAADFDHSPYESQPHVSAPNVVETVSGLYFSHDTSMGTPDSLAAVQIMFEAGFTVGLRANGEFGETQASLDVYEVTFTLATEGAPSAPQPFRARQRLHPIASARRWPREPWSGTSPRRVGGYR